jgi:hypothetical protein
MEGRAVRLHADDAHLRPLRLHREADSAGQPAAADGDHDRVDVRPLRQHLEADRALAGDDPRDRRTVHEDEVARGPISRAWSYASSKFPPNRITSAPSRRAEVTFTRGAHSGMTMTAGMPSFAAWWATASPWFPALAAMTPAAVRRGRAAAGGWRHRAP